MRYKKDILFSQWQNTARQKLTELLGVCTYKDSIVNIYHCGCNYIPGIARCFDMCDLAGLIAPRGLIIAAGEKDSIFPIDGVKFTCNYAKELFATAESEDKIKLVIGDEGHRYYANLTFDALEKMRGGKL